MSSQRPSWLRPTTVHLNKRVSGFKANLRLIAEGLARHDRVDSVSVKHVDEAHTVLAKSGLSRTPWYCRTELQVGLGTALIAIALAAPTIVTMIAGGEHTAIVKGVFGVGMIAGLVLCITGWGRGSHLPPLPANQHRRRWACWPWTECKHADHEREESCR